MGKSVVVRGSILTTGEVVVAVLLEEKQASIAFLDCKEWKYEKL